MIQLTKDRLEYCRDLAQEVEALDRQIEQLETRAVSRKWPDGLPHSNFAADRLSGIAVKIADLDIARTPKKEELSRLRSEIEEGMATLAPKESLLIRLRYLYALPWEEVAREIGYSTSQAYEIHKKILQKTKSPE